MEKYGSGLSELQEHLKSDGFDMVYDYRTDGYAEGRVWVFEDGMDPTTEELPERLMVICGVSSKAKQESLQKLRYDVWQSIVRAQNFTPKRYEIIYGGVPIEDRDIPEGDIAVIEVGSAYYMSPYTENE